MRHAGSEFQIKQNMLKNYNPILIFLLLITFSFNSYAQQIYQATKKKNCNCKIKPNLNEVISCDTIVFKNGSKLYRQFNCDSSWLTFKSKSNSKVLYSLEKPFIELTERLGFQFIKEYENSLLFENRQVSGGGFPENYELLDKDNAKVIANFGSIIYHSDLDSENYILYLSDDSLNTVTYYDIRSQSKFNFSIPKGRLRKTVMDSSQMFPEYLFDKPTLKNNILVLVYKYLENSETNKWNTDIIKIDLKTIHQH